MSDYQFQKERWESIGFELRSLETQRFYLTRTFQDVIFIVRHANNTVLLPELEHPFRVCFKDRETGALNSETRMANGVDELLNLILSWRLELHPPGLPRTTHILLAGRFMNALARDSRQISERS
ncbi:hypothetical protein HX878_22340 [Pseudomonas veronii]|uniref:hypothetical protein n=1 Tax=Pseudomonas veronii TaxID=76761 RepID=UPI0015A369D5|nr:hypothetical protein [Pseudomonas veronii]NWD57467.1 hypothetical protein [Pseudomonas veronii]